MNVPASSFQYYVVCKCGGRLVAPMADIRARRCREDLKDHIVQSISCNTNYYVFHCGSNDGLGGNCFMSHDNGCVGIGSDYITRVVQLFIFSNHVSGKVHMSGSIFGPPGELMQEILKAE